MSNEHDKTKPTLHDGKLSLAARRTMDVSSIDAGYFQESKLAVLAFQNDLLKSAQIIERAAREANERLSEMAKQMANSSQGIHQQLAALTSGTLDATDQLRKVCSDVYRSFVNPLEQASRLSSAGWIPHRLLPLGKLVGTEMDPSAISEAVSAYVANNRPRIYATLRESFTSHAIEPYTCQVCLDAVTAHENGLFRLVVPSIFPEIERCARTALKLRAAHGKKIIERLVTQIEKLTPIGPDAIMMLEILDLLESHIYESVRSEDDAERLRAIPNRHGYQHGWSRSETSRDGLNALFLADSVLAACAAISAASGVLSLSGRPVAPQRTAETLPIGSLEPGTSEHTSQPSAEGCER
jgi:hypothetical protein